MSKNRSSCTPLPEFCTLSIVIPVYNERDVLPLFYRRLARALADLPSENEVLFVDDGSTDDTPQILEALRQGDSRVGVARLTRNFGKERAISAGLELARGDAVVIIDADLQDPPEQIVHMFQAWQAGAEVVNMRRRQRDGETLLKKATSHAFYRVINRISDVPIAHDVGDFRLLSRRAVTALNSLPERCRFMKGMFAWIGFEQVTLDYDRHARHAGRTKWQYWGLWNYALDGITSFSTAPLKLAMYTGLISAISAFLYAFYFLLKAIIVGDPVQGFPTLIITMLLLGGLQLIAAGVMGEYIGRLYVEVKQRPQYVLSYYHQASINANSTKSLNHQIT
ncbi:glycosyltransferase [Pusillimonas caeni]|uniref:glycosyltransferase family 2 protein n=1 Tax=Pusillimonas caeni TaxID=1348472 RepID=UPI000E59EEDA|nr:glycosyltransferase family 2 protein [Pusillimonas caeni]TFL14041.1 glycosyltransferase [Pusillimonas caeni]